MIDVQSDIVLDQFAIESVGVTGLEYPIQARDAATGEVQATTATWRMGVALRADKRGTHMSRFIEELHARVTSPMDLNDHYDFAKALSVALAADSTSIRATFPWFRAVAAPVTGRTALISCQVTFAATSDLGGERAAKSLSIKVPAKALCPCSKAISDRGAHNQRSDITLTVDYRPDAPVAALGRLIALVETSASSPVYPLLKRDDEKHVTEQAYDNPAFVEDIVRAVASKMTDVPHVRGFVVEAINRESIHAHDCYARISHRF